MSQIVIALPGNKFDTMDVEPIESLSSRFYSKHVAPRMTDAIATYGGCPSFDEYMVYMPNECFRAVKQIVDAVEFRDGRPYFGHCRIRGLDELNNEDAARAFAQLGNLP